MYSLVQFEILNWTNEYMKSNKNYHNNWTTSITFIISFTHCFTFNVLIW
jgi:hypothetical protein